jgi:chromosome segregation ATPase
MFGALRGPRVRLHARAAGRDREHDLPPITAVTDPAASCCRRGTVTVSTRETAKVRERLTRIQEHLKRVRASERVLDEQVHHLDELAAEAETRRLVARTPLADREWREARTDLDRHAELLEEERRKEEGLLAERDRLLERLLELEGPS